ncbi:MAG: sigma 54-interacting transcriptional regulator, partial [Spirochaetia bacterium]
ADGGTLFLDEVGAMSLPLQAKILRAIQEHTFERVGDTRTRKVDVRIVAATNENLGRAVRENRFREDLYYRLRVVPIEIPPLRERREDIEAITRYLLHRIGANRGRALRLAPTAMDAPMNYTWPGNVRELENVIERAAVLSIDGVIHSHHLPPTLQSAESTGTVVSGSLQAQLDNLERELVIDALKSTKGNMTKAAQLLQITERIMGLRVQKHGIDPRKYRTRS